MDALQLVPGTSSHYDDFHQIPSEEKNLFWTGYAQAPDYDQFREWYLQRLGDPDRKTYLLMKEGAAIASLHLDYEEEVAGTGYNVREAYEGQGMATYLLRAGIRIAEGEKRDRRPRLTTLKAWVYVENKASARVAEKMATQKVRSWRQKQDWVRLHFSTFLKETYKIT